MRQVYKIKTQDERLQPPDFPTGMMNTTTPKYGIVTFLLKRKDGTLTTCTALAEVKDKEEIAKFLIARNHQLEEGEWAAFDSRFRGRTRKAIYLVKEILKEINNGRIAIRGNKNAKGTV